MTWAYTTVEQLADTLTITEDKLDAEKAGWLRDIIEGVSQQIDNHTDRTFRIYDAAQVFTPEFNDYLLTPDLLTLTSLKVDFNLDGVYERTLSGTTDYYLEPSNAVVRERPFTRIKLRSRPTSFYAYFPLWEETVQITGRWGYWEKTRPSRVTITSAIDTDDDIFEVDDIQAIKVGWTILIDSEQMYVRAKSLLESTIEVERGINGTTAAAHLAAAAISYYVYPRPLVAATLLQAARIYRRSETPLGIVNNPGDIGWRAVYVPLLDLDVQTLLKVLRKQNMP